MMGEEEFFFGFNGFRSGFFIKGSQKLPETIPRMTIEETI